MPTNTDAISSYAKTVKSLSPAALRREIAGLREKEPEYAGAAAAELAARGLPLEAQAEREPATIDAGFHFRPSATIDGRTAIDIWHGAHHAATIYAGSAGIRIVCAPGFAPGPLSVQVQHPYSVSVDIERGGDSAWQWLGEAGTEGQI